MAESRDASHGQPIESLEPRLLLSGQTASAATAVVPRYDHVVVVFEENKDYRDVLGPGLVPSSVWSVVPPLASEQTTYIRKLARYGANFTHAHAEAHPSQPNYLAFFSGSTQNVSGDRVPARQFTGPSLGGELIAAGDTFASYSEGLPAAGSLVVTSGEYARKHNPASDFSDVPAKDNVPFSAFPGDYAKLPTVSLVIPNQSHDMHSGSIGAGDRWLESNIGPYARWAATHNSLLIVTWDEGSSTNHIATIIYGAGVKHGHVPTHINHYSLLSTIETMYGLPALGGKPAAARPIRSIFSKTAVAATVVQPAGAPSAAGASGGDSVWVRLSRDQGELGPLQI
jgi:acid phosphatase